MGLPPETYNLNFNWGLVGGQKTLVSVNISWLSRWGTAGMTPHRKCWPSTVSFASLEINFLFLPRAEVNEGSDTLTHSTRTSHITTSHVACGTTATSRHVVKDTLNAPHLPLQPLPFRFVWVERVVAGRGVAARCSSTDAVAYKTYLTTSPFAKHLTAIVTIQVASLAPVLSAALPVVFLP